MNTIEIAREQARETDGRFGAQHHSAPDITLEGGLSIGDAQAMIAATAIHHEAPIGARTASLYVNEDTGHITFSRYIDRNGRTVPTDGADDFNDTLRGATIAGFAAQPGVLQQDVDGEVWFLVDVEDLL